MHLECHYKISYNIKLEVKTRCQTPQRFASLQPWFLVVRQFCTHNTAAALLDQCNFQHRHQQLECFLDVRAAVGCLKIKQRYSMESPQAISCVNVKFMSDVSIIRSWCDKCCVSELYLYTKVSSAPVWDIRWTVGRVSQWWVVQHRPYGEQSTKSVGQFSQPMLLITDASSKTWPQPLFSTWSTTGKPTYYSVYKYSVWNVVHHTNIWWRKRELIEHQIQN